MRVVAALPARAWTAALVLVLAALGVAAAALAPAPAPLEARSSTGLGAAYGSVAAERASAALDAELGTEDAPVALVVVSRADGGAVAAEDLAAVGERVAAAGVAAGPTPPAQPSEDGAVALLPVPLPTGPDAADVGDLVQQLRDALAGTADGLVVEVTGGPAFTADLAAVFAGLDVTILAFTASVVAVLLLVTYRSPLLVVVPLLVVGAAEQTVLALVEQVVPRVGLALDPSGAGITSVLVFGAATNYALLLVARYREQLRVEARPADAMRTAVRRAGSAVLASGSTVVLAVLALTLSDVEGTQSLGVSAAVGIVVAMLAGLVVLPCALVLLGRAAFWPFVPRLGSVGREGRVWQRLGSGAARRPWLVAGAGVAVLALLAAPALGLRTGLSESEQFRETPEAVLGAETLARGFPAGAREPVEVLAPAGSADDVAAAARAVDGVLGADVVRTGATTAQVDVVLDAVPTSQRSLDLLEDVRAAVRAPDAGGPSTVLGGTVASAGDVADAQAHDRAVVVPVILGAVLLVLVLLLRALVAPLLLLLAVVATYGAAVGASWLVLTGPLGQPALDGTVLLLGFVFLVALGVDYSIFLTTRAREEAELRGTGPGMLAALRATGGVITSAGVLLAAVFAVLGVLPVVTLTQIGVLVGIGVLLDTLVVRTLLVPAAAFLLGRRFWWPARVGPDPGRAGGAAGERRAGAAT